MPVLTSMCHMDHLKIILGPLGVFYLWLLVISLKLLVILSFLVACEPGSSVRF